ncbi:unnamed protein product [Arctogadus glacialis]
MKGVVSICCFVSLLLLQATGEMLSGSRVSESRAVGISPRPSPLSALGEAVSSVAGGRASAVLTAVSPPSAFPSLKVRGWSSSRAGGNRTSGILSRLNKSLCPLAPCS